jgi:hypothetical protein
MLANWRTRKLRDEGLGDKTTCYGDSRMPGVIGMDSPTEHVSPLFIGELWLLAPRH